MQSKERYCVMPTQYPHDIPMDVEHVIFYSCSGCITKLNFTSSFFPHLRSIRMHEDCFTNTREMTIIGLRSLESVFITSGSFSLSDKQRKGGLLRISCCPNLREFITEYCCFNDFASVELSNLNALQRLQCLDDCFTTARLSLKSMSIHYNL